MTLEHIKQQWITHKKFNDKPFMIARKHQAELDSLYPQVEPLVAKLWLYVNNYDQSHMICSESKKNKRFMGFAQGPLKFCGNQSQCECNRQHAVKTRSTKTQDDLAAIQATRRKTSLKKYGTEYPSQSDQVKQRAAETCLARYGTVSPTQNPLIVEKTNTTFVEKYSVTRPAKNTNIREKMKQTMCDRYGAPYSMQVPEILEQARIKSKLAKYQSVLDHRQGFESLFSIDEYVSAGQEYEFKWRCVTCDTEFKQKLIPGNIFCPTCNPRSETWGETHIRQYLEKHHIPYVQRSRKIISPYELDFYIESRKIAVEFNGIYWHSDKIITDKKYHQKKYLKCKEQGIRLIQIFEHELVQKPSIIEDRLNYLFEINTTKIGARQCQIVELEHTQAKLFFESNHLQAHRPSKHVWGLMHNNELVAAISIGPARYSKSLADWEILRYATQKSIAVAGGLPKLFKHAVSQLNATSVVSYANLNWGSGTVYHHCGFELVRYSNPAYWYFKGVNQVYSRLAFQKHKLNNPENLSESAWAEANGFKRFYDTGNAVWVWKQR
jgi:very-short-patch-repair endonuclease